MNRMSPQPKNLGELRHSPWSEEKIAKRSVRQELRENLLQKMEKGEPLFPGVHGYDDTVIPQIVNAASLAPPFHFAGAARAGEVAHPARPGGFSGPADSLRRGLRDSRQSLSARSAAPAANALPREGDATPIAWLSRDHRYVEKLATPDVTIADMIGDVDPIKAARGGANLSDELTIHYGLLAAREPRNFRHQRTARPGRENSGGPVQHHAGRRRPD